jgi:hypothetical protein
MVKVLQRILLLALIFVAMSVPSSEPVLAQNDTHSNIEKQKLDLENQKLAVEREKLDVERGKAKWSAASTIVPLLGVLGTLIYSVWSFRKQMNNSATLQKEAAIETARLQNESAKLQFEIKAAEIAFSGITPEAVTNRARVLKKIFEDRLPANFPATLEPKDHGGGKESPDEKMFFLELLLKYPGKEKEIIRAWDKLFGDSWLERVKPVLLEEATTEDPIEKN